MKLLSYGNFIKKMQSVSIDNQKIVNFIDQNLSEIINTSLDTSDILGLSALDDLENKLKFILFFNSLNFCFWGKTSWEIVVEDKTYVRTNALVKCLSDYLIKDRKIIPVYEISGINYEKFINILKGGDNLNLMRERYESLILTAKILQEHEKDSVMSILVKCESNALQLEKYFEMNFPNFYDSSIYNNFTINFNKRIQVMISQISKITPIKHLDSLTAFADYRLPQILRHLGILKYKRFLSKLIDRQEYIEKNTDEEIEIRLATIHSVEMIKEEIAKRGISVTSSLIDSYLWTRSRRLDAVMKPHHRTITTAY